MRALIFDCDGVLVDTERDGHRVAFNKAFAQVGLNDCWDVDLYGQLLAVAGGKERMRYYFNRRGWPPDVTDHDDFIHALHARKTQLFMQMIEAGRLPLRTGVARLVDEAIAAGVKLAVCSTSHESAVQLIVKRLLGSERRARFEAILAGDVVAKKKPDPEIYRLVQSRLEVSADDCLVVEDSRNGLLAAKRAGMRCLVTTNAYTIADDFHEADQVVPELGDPPGDFVGLEQLMCLTSE